MFDTAETLKYNQSNWKWYEWVKLNGTTIMQSSTFVMLIVSEKIATRKFLPHQTIGWPNTDHHIDSHFSCESVIRKHSELGWKTYIC